MLFKAQPASPAPGPQATPAVENLYEVLGVPRSASSTEISAALRQLVRRFSDETAHGLRDSAEALKLVNRARLTFIDAERRAQYDAQLAAIEATEAKRAAAQLAQSRSDDKPADSSLPAVGPSTWTAAPSTQPVYLKSPTRPPETYGHESAAPVDSVLTIDLDELRLVGQASSSAAEPTSEPTGFDFAKVLAPTGLEAQRSTGPRPWTRLSARMIDYGLWGLILGALLEFLRLAGVVSRPNALLLASPLVAPVFITLSWAPIETLFLAFCAATPGKVLLDVRVAFRVSNPYAPNRPAARLGDAWLRAQRVWWRGMAAGVLPFSVMTLIAARSKLRRFKETTWDFDGDCLVTHGKVNALSGGLAAFLLGSGVFLYAYYWAMPLRQTLTEGWRYAEGGFKASQRVLDQARSAARPGDEVKPAVEENNTQTRQKAAQALIDARNWKDLAGHCLAWTRQDEREPLAWLCYGRALHELKEYTTAVAALKQAQRLAPQNDEIRRWLWDASAAEMHERQMRQRAGGERRQ